MENQDTAHIRETLREWIGLDDQIRALQAQIKTLRDRKTALGGNVLEFMQGNNLDNFVMQYELNFFFNLQINHRELLKL